MKNKKCALEALRSCEGVGFGTTFNPDGTPCCAIGVIAAACGGPDYSLYVSYFDWFGKEFDIEADELFIPNDAFIGTDRERRDHIISVVEGL